MEATFFNHFGNCKARRAKQNKTNTRESGDRASASTFSESWTFERIADAQRCAWRTKNM